MHIVLIKTSHILKVTFKVGSKYQPERHSWCLGKQNKNIKLQNLFISQGSLFSPSHWISVYVLIWQQKMKIFKATKPYFTTVNFLVL